MSKTKDHSASEQRNAAITARPRILIPATTSITLIAARCFHGTLPPIDPAIIAEGIISCVPCWRDASEQCTQAFVNLLIPKLSERILAQNASDKTEFQN